MARLPLSYKTTHHNLMSAASRETKISLFVERGILKPVKIFNFRGRFPPEFSILVE
jgi:hypothetical protein